MCFDVLYNFCLIYFSFEDEFNLQSTVKRIQYYSSQKPVTYQNTRRHMPENHRLHTYSPFNNKRTTTQRVREAAHWEKTIMHTQLEHKSANRMHQRGKPGDRWHSNIETDIINVNCKVGQSSDSERNSMARSSGRGN